MRIPWRLDAPVRYIIDAIVVFASNLVAVVLAICWFLLGMGHLWWALMVVSLAGIVGWVDLNLGRADWDRGNEA